MSGLFTENSGMVQGTSATKEVETPTSSTSNDFSAAIASIGTSIGDLKESMESAFAAAIASEVANNAMYDAVASATYDSMTKLHDEGKLTSNDREKSKDDKSGDKSHGKKGITTTELLATETTDALTQTKDAITQLVNALSLTTELLSEYTKNDRVLTDAELYDTLNKIGQMGLPPMPGGSPFSGRSPMPGGSPFSGRSPMPGGLPMPGGSPLPGGLPMPGGSPLPGGFPLLTGTDLTRQRMMENVTLTLMSKTIPDYMSKGDKVFDKILDDDLNVNVDIGQSIGMSASNIFSNIMDLLPRLGGLRRSGGKNTKSKNKNTKSNSKSNKPGNSNPRNPGSTKVAQQTGTKVAQQTGTKVAQQTGTKVAQQTGTKVAQQTGTKVASKTFNKVALKTGAKIATKVAAKTALKCIPVVGQVYAMVDAAIDIARAGKALYELNQTNKEVAKIIDQNVESSVEANERMKNGVNDDLRDANIKSDKADAELVKADNGIINQTLGIFGAKTDEVREKEFAAAMADADRKIELRRHRELLDRAEAYGIDRTDSEAVNKWLEGQKELAIQTGVNVEDKGAFIRFQNEELNRYKEAQKTAVEQGTQPNQQGQQGQQNQQMNHGVPDMVNQANIDPMAAGSTANTTQNTINAGTGAMTEDILSADEKLNQYRLFTFEAFRDALLLPEVRDMFTATAQTAGASVEQKLMG